MEKQHRAEIIAQGMVQGVGFRFFVYRNALKLGLKGFTKNLYSGDEVLTVVEGERFAIDELYKMIRIGPSHSTVNNCTIKWMENQNEFSTFEIRDF